MPLDPETGAREKEVPAGRVFFEDYRAAEAYLERFTDYERMEKGTSYPDDLFDLKRIEGLLERVGNPHRAFGGVHVAGTKGKGSTATFVDAILSAHGVKTGLFTSPHLVDKEERIRVKGRHLRREEFLDLMNQVGPALMERKDSGAPPTFFDIITTLSFLQFRASCVQAAIMEVGLGGRLDSTNVFQPDVGMITRLGLDHTEKLGNTLSRIASEKAGIVKPGVPFVSHPQEPEARRVLEDRCRALEAPLSWVGEQIIVEEADGGDPSLFTVSTALGRYEGLQLSVLGRHQRTNAGAAVAASELFLSDRSGKNLDPERVRRGLAAARLPGRIEVVARDPLFILDGAHNPVAVEVLLKTVLEELRFRDLHVIFACCADKDIPGMLRQLAPCTKRWTVTFFDFPRIEDPERVHGILTRVDPSADVCVTRTPDEAIEDAFARSDSEDCILCCGSFYLVGQMLQRMPLSRDQAGAGGGKPVQLDRLP